MEGDIAVGLFAVEPEELGDDGVRHIGVDARAELDDALFQQGRVDVVGAVASAAGLDHHRHHGARLCVGGVPCRAPRN